MNVKDFNIKFPIDWDKWWSSPQTDGFQRCEPTCGCEETCAADEETESLKLALADAAIALSEANKTLADLIDAIYGEL